MSTPDWTAQARQIADESVPHEHAAMLGANAQRMIRVTVLTQRIAAALAAAYHQGREETWKEAADFCDGNRMTPEKVPIQIDRLHTDGWNQSLHNVGAYFRSQAVKHG